MEVLPAVDDDRLSGHKRRAGAGQVHHRADHILRLLVALERARADGHVTQLLDHLGVLHHARAHREARRDAVHQHVVAAQLLRERAGEGDDRALAGDVVQQEGDAAERRARGDVHDPAAAALAHTRHDGTAREEHAEHVDVHHLAPLVDGDLVERAHRQRRVQAGVVDEDVDAAARLDGVRRHALDRRLVRDVDRQADTVRVGGRRRLGALEVGDHDPRALGCQSHGDCLADALGAAGDDRDLAAERAHRIGEKVVGNRMRLRCTWISGCSFGRNAFQPASACNSARRRSRSANES